MADANAPIAVKEVLFLPDIGIDDQFITSTNVTMESGSKYICVIETAPQNRLVIIDMSMPMQQLRHPVTPTPHSALMNPNSGILALRGQTSGTAQPILQIFNLEMKKKTKSHRMNQQVEFWKWISPIMLGLVTRTSVYHWSIDGDSEPVKMFERTDNLVNNRIISYKCDPSEKWLVLIGIAPEAPEPESSQFIKANMQLFSVDQNRSRTREAHAASFAQFKFPGNENSSILLSFATNTIDASGHIASTLHVVELGKLSFSQKKADLVFPPDFQDDFPVAIQISEKYSLIYVVTKLGLLFVYDLETVTAVCRNRISPDRIILTSEASVLGGIYVINRRGNVLLATINEATIVPFVNGQLNNLELAVNLAKRANIPLPENLIIQRFEELFAQTKYKEAAELAAESAQGILRTPGTLAKFQSAPVEAGQTPLLLHYFGMLLTRGKLNAFESLELSRFALNQNKKRILEKCLAEDKLECSEELGDLVKTVDDELALKTYIKAKATPKVVAAFALDRIFKNLFPQFEYSPGNLLFVQTVLGTHQQPRLLPYPSHLSIKVEDDDIIEGGSSRKIWIFLVVNLAIEIASAALDQVASVHKPEFGLAAMILALVGLLGCMTELAFKGGKEKARWKWDMEIPWFYCSTDSPSGYRLFGNFAEIFGLACAMLQSISAIVAFVLYSRHADYPIKTSYLPLLFALGLLFSQFLKDRCPKLTHQD